MPMTHTPHAPGCNADLEPTTAHTDPANSTKGYDNDSSLVVFHRWSMIIYMSSNLTCWPFYFVARLSRSVEKESSFSGDGDDSWSGSVCRRHRTHRGDSADESHASVSCVALSSSSTIYLASLGRFHTFKILDQGSETNARVFVTMSIIWSGQSWFHVTNFELYVTYTFVPSPSPAWAASPYARLRSICRRACAVSSWVKAQYK